LPSVIPCEGPSAAEGQPDTHKQRLADLEQKATAPALAQRLSGTTVEPRLHRAHQSVQRHDHRINWVQIDLGKDAEDADHDLSAEDGLRVAMARQ
jgi:hypothetical protein